MHTLLPSHQVLSIRFCPELESFPDGVLPSSLNSLETYSCEKLIAGRLGWGLQALPSLRRFCMRGKFEISEYFPERELLPSSLTSHEIWNNPLSKSLNGDQLYLHWGLAAAQLFIPCQKRVCQHLYVSWVSRNVQLFIAEKSVPKGERERLVQDSSRTSYQNWWKSYLNMKSLISTGTPAVQYIQLLLRYSAIC